MIGASGEVATRAPGRSALSAWPGRIFYHVVLNAHWILLRASGVRKPSRSVPRRHSRSVLLTGTFYSGNWILNHLKPLAASRQCDKILVVTTFAIPPVEKVEAIHPPFWLVRSLGEVPARLIYFVVTAIRRRPDFVGGFHLLPNGLVALLLARFIGSWCVYFCGGGPREVEDGGYYSGARSFRLLKAPDAALERKLLRAVDEIDLVITMGSGAQDFFRTRGVRSRIEVVPGGIDSRRFQFEDQRKLYDLILIGRLHPVKRIDLFLRTVEKLAESIPDVSAVIVGGGELEGSLKALAVELGLGERVTFTGQQPDVRPWLAQSRIFVLTSESEGLSLALMEAMTGGLPCVVANVGELGELVEHGSTGFLVDDDSPEAFCFFLEQLLRSESARDAFSKASREAASRLTIAETAKRWDRILAEY
jgi:glycosyltransferase involved in cell wall biosynthesis